jgi:hypothetical protein
VVRVEFPQARSLKNNTFLITKNSSHDFCYRQHADNFFFLGDINVVLFHSMPLKIRIQLRSWVSSPVIICNKKASHVVLVEKVLTGFLATLCASASIHSKNKPWNRQAGLILEPESK